MQFECTKDMPVHVSTCNSYDFNILTPVVWKYGADKTCFSMSCHKNELSVLEQEINIKFCVKLHKNGSGTCAMLSKAYKREAMNKSSVYESHKWFEEHHENMEDDERSGCTRSHRINENADAESDAFRKTFKYQSYSSATKFRQRHLKKV
jgi:hypothetical protein